jgi:hypothetical protein
VLRGIGSRAAMLAGCLLLLAGVAVTFGAIATTTTAAFLAGTAVAGAGFGLGFSGAFRDPAGHRPTGRQTGNDRQALRLASVWGSQAGSHHRPTSGYAQPR